MSDAFFFLVVSKQKSNNNHNDNDRVEYSTQCFISFSHGEENPCTFLQIQLDGIEFEENMTTTGTHTKNSQIFTEQRFILGTK